MNERAFKASRGIKSALSQRKKNELIEKYGDEIQRRKENGETQEDITKDIIGREKRGNPVVFFLLSYLIEYFISQLIKKMFS